MIKKELCLIFPPTMGRGEPGNIIVCMFFREQQKIKNETDGEIMREEKRRRQPFT